MFRSSLKHFLFKFVNNKNVHLFYSQTKTSKRLIDYNHNGTIINVIPQAGQSMSCIFARPFHTAMKIASGISPHSYIHFLIQ